MHWNFALPAATFALALLCAEARADSISLDQEFTAIGQGPTRIGGPLDEGVAQSFVAGLSGRLSRVDLYLMRYETSDDLVVYIQRLSTDQDHPSVGAAIGSVTVAASGVYQSDAFFGLAGDWVTIDVSALGIEIQAGERLAIILMKSPGDTGGADGYTGVYGWQRYQNDYSWQSNAPNYANGHAFHGAYGNCSLPEPEDMLFRTYVQPVPEPMTAALVGLGCALLAWHRRESARTGTPRACEAIEGFLLGRGAHARGRLAAGQTSEPPEVGWPAD